MRANPSAKTAKGGRDTGEPDEAKVSRPVRREAVGKVSVTGQLAGGPPYFAGVLVELAFDGERYAVVETALDSGSRLLRFRSDSRRLAYALLGGAGRKSSRRCGIRRLCTSIQLGNQPSTTETS